MAFADYPESFTLEDLRWMCDCARLTLIAEHGYRERDFVLADDDVTIYSPASGLIHEDSDHPELRAYCTPLPGTWLYWSFCPYAGDGDAEAAIAVLSQIEFWSEWEPTPEDLAEWNVPAALEGDGHSAGGAR